jgi:hypothetical protein
MIVMTTSAVLIGMSTLVAQDSTSPAPTGSSSASPHESDDWSAPINGLQVRLELVEKPKLNGTRWLVPYLHLRNVHDIAYAMEVQCDNRHLKVELVDKDGKAIRNGSSLSRSGPTPDPGAVILPWDSSMRISLECRNWGVRKNVAAMVSTDSGAWAITEQEKGNVYIRLTLSGDPSKFVQKRWRGEIRTPLVPVDWK